MLHGAHQLNLQIETIQRLTASLTRDLGKPVVGVQQPFMESQLRTVTNLTQTVDELMTDVLQIRTMFLGMFFYVPYVLGVIAGTFLITLIISILVCCLFRRRSSKMSGVKGEWTMQPTRHHNGSNPRYEEVNTAR